MNTQNTQAQDEIIDSVGADNWQQVVDEYAGRPAIEINVLLNEMFPTEDNGDLAERIYQELKNGPMNADEELLQAEQEDTDDRE